MSDTPLISIITPTVMRQSLLDTCRSIDEQTFSSWQHVVIVDKEEFDPSIIEQIVHPQRVIVKCPKPHRNGGNTCRHNAWHFALGTFCWHVDDDNTLASPRTLQQIAKQLEKVGTDVAWTLWPIFRHGHIFFFDPPAPCYFDTGNAIVRREFAQWPDIDDYASDAVWLQQFKDKPYVAFPESLPIMLMEKTSFGEGGGINGE